MILITHHIKYIKIDFNDFIENEKVLYSPIFIMKDQSFEVRCEKNGNWVEVWTPTGMKQLDMNGQNGFPAKIQNKVPDDNFELGYLLSELKNL